MIPQYNIIFYNINTYYKQKRLLLIKTNLTKSSYGKELYQASDDGLNKWIEAAYEGKVGRGRLIGKKR
jgi:hypothetical protein